MSDIKECKDFCGCLSDYLDGTMDEKCRQVVEEHLKSCETCSLMYETLKTTVLVCSKGLLAEIPEDVRESLRSFLKVHCKKECV